MNKLCPLGPAGVGRIVNLFFGPAWVPSCNYTKHQLIINPEAAEIVKKIYEMCLQGTAKLQIVMYLNDHGIPSPTAYRKLKGLPYSPAISDAPMWGNKIITDILRNPI